LGYLRGRKTRWAICRIVRVDHLVQKIAARSWDERSRQIVQFVVTSEQVIADTEIKGELPADLPIILEVSAELQIPPVPNIALECRNRILIKTAARRAANPWIYPSIFFRRGISGEE